MVTWFMTKMSLLGSGERMIFSINEVSQLDIHMERDKPLQHMQKSILCGLRI